MAAEKILSKTGIRERRISSKDECASDLAVTASEKLLTKYDRNKIEFLIFCTQSPEYLLPSNACLIQDRLKLPTTCGALDINLGCSGFVYGLGLAKSLIESGQVGNVLLLNADTYTKYINPKDKSVRTLFGDAATATLIGSENGIAKLTGPFVYGTDGRGKNNLIVKTRGLRNDYVFDAKLETDNSGNARTINDLYMNGVEIFSFTSFSVPTLIKDTLKKANLSMENIDLFVFHQANIFILNHLQKLLFIDKDKMVISMENTGNTVSLHNTYCIKRHDGKKSIKRRL